MSLMRIEQTSCCDLSVSFKKSIDCINILNQSIETVSDKNASIADRIAAYQNFANMQAHFAALSEQGNAFFTKALTKLDALMSTMPLEVDDVTKDHGSKPPLLHLEYQGRDATLLDLVNAINVKDTNADFTVTSHFEKAEDSVADTAPAWCSNLRSDSYMGLEHATENIEFHASIFFNVFDRDDRANDKSEITYRCHAESAWNRDVDFSAKGSCTAWEGYATCAQGDGFKNAYNDLVAVLR